jgi:hypothetical protein
LSRRTKFEWMTSGLRPDLEFTASRREILHGIGVPNHTVPYGTVPSGGRFFRHFVPGYNHAVLPGQKPFTQVPPL